MSVFYNGANRIFTDYTYTDGNSSRHYNNTPSKTYRIRYGTTDPDCGVLVSYSTPYGGGCTVDGIGSGGMLKRESADTCAAAAAPLDDYLPVLVIISAAFFGYHIHNFRKAKVYS